ncbi:TaqI family restriction endonuclease [Thermodesulfovibrio yellowstonii]|uniref:Type II restriction enzyme TaqI n=2 Tax=Thermodesulfovibrio TaxID=28261 RepID=B5YJE3_THEYD|nr:TaqI family restriction endonuclease [Thermodesulfovibrio yellowstonii]ACI20194.1 type II restriction enzyme TaqI [Thermodesulfovibrio yellowstonii DSM 11347]MDI6864389.1 TaqI family restriction endonuclease [Thermodesulfovibrio yellowstonii]
MKEPLKDLQRFRDFLSSIPLDKYREELKNIKWVEQDLPKEILPLSSIFRYYWEERNFLNFEEWFENFWQHINNNQESKRALEDFKKYYFNRDLGENDWFKKGFKARMYRTWVSVLTQLDFCYLFEYICDKESKNLKLECNSELDRKGIDARVNEINFQIAKITQRKEARSASKKKSLITIPYAVFNLEDFERKIGSKRVKDKTGYQNSLEAFKKYFIRLNNGFVVFHENYLRTIIENISDIEKLKKVVEEISRELAGG